jgi:hypothetical protein
MKYFVFAQNLQIPSIADITGQQGILPHHTNAGNMNSSGTRRRQVNYFSAENY